jgi:hypothetical protein
MLLNRYCPLFFPALLCITSCIEPFAPGLQGEADDVYVISGEVTDRPGYQQVTVSRAAVIDAPEYMPAEGCSLTIEDSEGNTFPMEEYEAGEYRAWMDQPYLQSGRSYRLRLITPTGDEIRSAYDEMPSGAELDSAYYVREEITDETTGETSLGIQFYVDFSGSETDSRNYRWTAEETWEYHSPYVIEYYYNGVRNTVFPPDSSLRVCWETKMVPEIFCLSTAKLTSNAVEGLRLHFVDNTTTKLYEGYSVLIRQHALSEDARLYWEQMRINSETGGGLYEKQPLPVKGNLQHISSRQKKVLGYFGASSVSQKRLFISGIRDIGIFYDAVCSYYPLGRLGWREFSRYDYPVYFGFFNRALRIIEKSCVDCRLIGGTLEKPEFWPQ